MVRYYVEEYDDSFYVAKAPYGLDDVEEVLEKLTRFLKAHDDFKRTDLYKNLIKWEYVSLEDWKNVFEDVTAFEIAKLAEIIKALEDFYLLAFAATRMYDFNGELVDEEEIEFLPKCKVKVKDKIKDLDLEMML